MKQIFLGIATVACLAVGCSKDEAPAPVIESRVYNELGASLGATRTTLSGFKIHWSVNDILSVWSDKSNMPLDYTIFEGVNSSRAKFRANDETKGVTGSKFYAVYPSSLVTGPGTLMLPVEQTYLDVENFSTNTFPMAAVSEDMMSMPFENLCGILVVDLSGVGFNVTDIQLQSYDQSLAGAATIDFSGATPKLTCSGSTTLALNCGSVALASDSKAFYFVVPAGTYTQGIDITINAFSRTAGAMTFKKSRKSSFTINAGTVTRIGARFVLDATTYKVGDLYDAGGKKGVVFDVDATGRSGKIVALNDCSGTYLWGPNATRPLNVTNAEDGMPNMTLIKTKNLLATYPAYKACADLGEDWYLPASGELSLINDSWLDIQTALEDLGETTGATAMDADTYWASNVSAKRPYVLSYLNYSGEFVTCEPKDQPACSVRAVAQF